MNKEIKRLLADNGNALPAYAWPGGYPILYLDGGNCVLCPDCATKSALDPDEDERCKPQAHFIHYEGKPEICEDCNKATESAYGDPDEQ